MTTRTIDTGIRCMSWQYLLLHLLGEGLIEEKEAGEILESMKDQFEMCIRDSYNCIHGCTDIMAHIG